MARRDTVPEPPILDRCPVCGGALENGFLSGGLGWTRERPSDLWGPLHATEPILQTGLGSPHSVAAQRCPACSIYVFHRAGDPPTG